MKDIYDPAERRRLAEYVRHVESAADAGAASSGEAAATSVATIPVKLFRVSEIAQHLGLTRQTVHNYATIGLITEETRTPGGQRLFSESVFGRLIQIQHLKRTHRLYDIRRLLEGGGASSEEFRDRENADA
jgi:hypothetical protein